MKSLFGEVEQPKHAEVMRYVLLVIYLASKLSKDKHRLNTIAEGIELAARQAQHFSVTHDNVFSSIAELYEQSVSTLAVRVQVVGSAHYLRQPAIAQRIRSQLFGAIRNAFLWRQLGGSQFHIMMRRKAVANALPIV
jgi:high frequency lysogenization protein